MKIFLSVVSHGHASMIRDLDCLSKFSNVQIVVKSNKSGDEFSELVKKDNFYWINNSYDKGFGENNNIVYNFCRDRLLMKDDDYFIVVNPDVVIEENCIVELVDLMYRLNYKLATINLFKDHKKTVFDNSIRNFPKFTHFLKSFLANRNETIIDKENICYDSEVEWSAGSFIAFQAQHFRTIKGFDEGYFMYCEDIDICYRSHSVGVPVMYVPKICAVHLAQHANRSIFSKHFLWHIRSVFRFLLSKRGFVTFRSSVDPSK